MIRNRTAVGYINQEKTIKSKKPLGRYKSMDELSAAKMESAKDLSETVDINIFKKNGHVK